MDAINSLVGGMRRAQATFDAAAQQLAAADLPTATNPDPTNPVAAAAADTGRRRRRSTRDDDGRGRHAPRHHGGVALGVQPLPRLDRPHPPERPTELVVVSRRAAALRGSRRSAGRCVAARPLCSITHQSACDRNSGWCVATITVLPDAARSVRISISAPWAFMSSPTNGSSTMRSAAGTDERDRERGLLAHAAAEPRRQVVGAIGELEPLHDLAARCLPIVDAVQAGDVLEVFPHAEIVVERRVVARVAERGTRVEVIPPRARRRAPTPLGRFDETRRSTPSRVDLPAPL